MFMKWAGRPGFIPFVGCSHTCRRTASAGRLLGQVLVVTQYHNGT